MYIEGGEIVAIPLFMAHDGNLKLKKEAHNQRFAFARVIEESAGKVLIEIFQKTGALEANVDDIVSSGLLMKPLYTIWSGVKKEDGKLFLKPLTTIR